MLYTWYGDDFTGSTDVLEQLASNGVPAVLFLGVPTPAQLEAFPEAQAIGIAGNSRSQTPAWMSAHLPAIFATMRGWGAVVAQYKVCSTFDSGPHLGSIGRALELGLEAFAPEFVPVLVGAPHLRRYVAFGNLFAAAPDGFVERIDRHPMAHHPVTPMCEADLRTHLAKQTNVAIGLHDLVSLQAGTPVAQDGTSPVVLFDTVDAGTLAAAGEIVWTQAARRPVFSVSSSGLTAALTTVWRRLGLVPERPPANRPIERSSPLLVVSGSCSAVTARQIRYALAHGFRGFPVVPEEAGTPGTLALVAESLHAGFDTVVYTSLGLTGAVKQGADLGASLGVLIRNVVERTGIRRVLLCGGDTSSHAVPQLGFYALTWLANLQPGAPLCVAHAGVGGGGLQLVLKGGQVGTDDFFRVVRDGS